ncbi:uncharacterized protein LOC128389079 [Panonychus citri]|uniref:uncharacterized protein LOC128389079 n=1 Tax=Panonychus citri TaxID=50023 RepID=UPI0023070B5F|nr:uncharacterized protein LOC128389079 [Panonychus citri]
MSLNDLPDNCLSKILENVREVEELIQLSEVCSRWSDLIMPRFNQVKYLQMMSDEQVDYIDKSRLWINYDTTISDYNLMNFFPNLKIIEVSPFACLSLRSYNLTKMINNSSKIKGLIGLYEPFAIRFNLENIELVSSDFQFQFKRIFRPDQLKQIRFRRIRLSRLSQIIEYFPNLKRISLTLRNGSFFTWPLMRRVLSKFPKLHHLSIRYSKEIDDNHVKELVKILPEIKLLDLRRSKGVTSQSADYLNEFCLKSRRSIEIYYDCEEEPTEWPKLGIPREPIAYGFDFMKHCFYKNFSSLPFLIDE